MNREYSSKWHSFPYRCSRKRLNGFDVLALISLTHFQIDLFVRKCVNFFFFSFSRNECPFEVKFSTKNEFLSKLYWNSISLLLTNSKRKVFMSMRTNRWYPQRTCVRCYLEMQLKLIVWKILLYWHVGENNWIGTLKNVVLRIYKFRNLLNIFGKEGSHKRYREWPLRSLLLHHTSRSG